MKSLGNLILKRKKEIKITLTDKDIFFVFGKVVKEEFGNFGVGKFQPNYYKNGTVFVKSENSLWASELWTNRNKIIKKMNSELGAKVIRDIKMK